MNVNGIAASLNFGTCVGFDGGRFHKAPDKALSLMHLRAYNDWHIDEWCGAYPGRFIPCALLPTWDMDATVEEIKRIAKKGCTAVSLNENPTTQGLPSVHNEYWEPDVEGDYRPRHDHVPAYRRRQPGSACLDGNAHRGLDHHHADVERDRRGRLAEPVGAGALSRA